MSNALAYDLLIILTGGLIAILICRLLRVSVLVGYLLVGILIGKGCLGWVIDEHHEIAHLAEAGVFLLLFAIGLEFSLDELWRLRGNVFLGGSVQMLLIALPVIFILQFFGMSWQSAMLIGAATAFSSTVLVFKALSEWGHSNLPHGRRAISILLFQDAALIPLLLMVPLLTGDKEAVGFAQYAALVLVSVLFVLGVIGLRYVLSAYVVPLFTSYRNLELIVLFTLVSLGGITVAAHAVGLPPAIGAFAAGLVFSGNRWTSQIDALMLPFREAFAAIFFVSLGLLFEPSLLRSEPLLMLGLFVALLAIKALAATTSLRLTGLQWKEAAGMGVGLSHVGEFAFVLVLLGAESGVIDEATYQRAVILAIGSLLVTPLLLKAGLKWTQQTNAGETNHRLHRACPDARHVIVIGAGPVGSKVTNHLVHQGCDVCLIDFSPVNLNDFAQQGIRVVAGDAIDEQILKIADTRSADLFVVAVPDDETAVQIVSTARRLNESCHILVRCRYQANEDRLTKVGAGLVVSEERQAGSALVQELGSVQRAGTNGMLTALGSP